MGYVDVVGGAIMGSPAPLSSLELEDVNTIRNL